MLHTFGQEEALADKIKVVVNRVGSEEGDISLKKAEETIGKPIFWQVPNDYKAMLGSRNAGEPLVMHAPKCKTQVSLHGLAATLCGNGTEQPKKERRGFFSFR
jgi:pilus assembly protein CpaE